VLLAWTELEDLVYQLVSSEAVDAKGVARLRLLLRERFEPGLPSAETTSWSRRSRESSTG
jgi:hypothetical protein